jgi:exoribonuclease-2
LNQDGSIAEINLENSTIRPTYMMTYEGASEFLVLKIEEESELNLLSDATVLCLKWPPDDPETLINLYLQEQSNPAMRLVSEMLILHARGKCKGIDQC